MQVGGWVAEQEPGVRSLGCGARCLVPLLCCFVSNSLGEGNEGLQARLAALRCTVTVAVPISLDFNQNDMRMWLRRLAEHLPHRKQLKIVSCSYCCCFLLVAVSGIVILVYFTSKKLKWYSRGLRRGLLFLKLYFFPAWSLVRGLQLFFPVLFNSPLRKSWNSLRATESRATCDYWAIDIWLAQLTIGISNYI